MLTALLKSFPIYSQKIVLSNAGKDTSVCFTNTQAKYLLKRYYRANELEQLQKFYELKISLLDSVSKHKDYSLSLKDSVISNKNGIISLMGKDIELIKRADKKELRKQKFYKWVAIACGVFTTSFVTYKLVSK